MASLPLDTWIRLIIWLAIGMVIYFTYGRHHSRVQKLVPTPTKSKSPATEFHILLRPATPFRLEGRCCLRS